MRIRLPSAVVLISLLVVSFAGRGRTAERPLIADELHAQAFTQGTVRVIVRLNAPFVPEGKLASPAHVVSQRHMLSGVQSTVRGQLRAVRHRVARDFSGTLPLMAIEAGPDALRMLASLRGIVADVQEDQLSAPGLAESIPVINGAEVWSAGYDGANQIVAILDTGVQKSHPFFAGGKVIAEACFSTTFAADGSTSVCPGGAQTSFAPGAGLPCSVAGNGCKHGTHVAGIVAGSNASFSGVAKGASIIAVQVFSRFPAGHLLCGGSACVLSYTSDQIAALNHVNTKRQDFAGRRIAAVNMSLGGGQHFSTCPSDPRALVIDQLRAPDPSDPTDPGVATVIAAGNNGLKSSISAPACNPSAIPVASSTKSDAVSDFSNMASPAIFPNLLIAPGSSITSSVPTSTFAVFSGTSMAAPHVAGTFAVLRQIVPTATVDEVLTQLKGTGTPILDTRPGGNATAPRADVLAAALELSTPNLVVQTLTAPTVAIPGSSVSVSTSIRSVGVDPVGASNLQLYLSTDNVITTGDTPLGNVIAFNALVGGTVSPVETVSVQIPVATTAGTYYIGAIADVDDQVAEGNESDNTKAVQIQILLPDLTVTAITATAGTVVPGQNVSVAHTVKNLAIPPAHAPASTSTLYLSDDAVLGGDVSLGTVAVPALTAGASKSVTKSAQIPGDASAGQYWIFAVANDGPAFAEADTANNAKATATPIIVGPDLIVTAATPAPIATAPGLTVNISNTIKNQGAQAVGAFDVGFYLSTNNTYDDRADVLLTTRSVASLAAGGTSTATTPVTIPSSLSAGSYFLIVRADSGDVVAEANEGNNLKATAALQVVRPDLTVVSVTSPARGAPGMNVSVSHAVKNLAAAAGKAGATVSRLYLSADTTLDSGDTALLDVPVGALAGGATATVTRSAQIPSGTPVGVYWIIAEANATGTVVETNAGNNAKATTAAIIVGPDLAVSAASATPGATAPGRTVNVSHTVKNQGGQAAGAFTVGIYLSADSALDDGVDVLLNSRSVSGLAPATVSTAITPVVIPANLSSGVYFLIVRADIAGGAAGEVSEADEANNTRAVTVNVVRADLTVVSVTAPARGAPGMNVSVSHVVRNLAPAAGAAPASTSRLYLSADGILDGGDPTLLSVPVTTLAGGAQTTLTRSVQLPPGTAPGLYWIIALADVTDAVVESNEGNNAKATLLPIIVGPDVIVSAATAPSIAAPNASLKVTTTIRNQGGPATMSSIVRFVLVPSSGPEVLLEASRSVPSLAPGAVSGPIATTVVLPANASAGSYFIRVVADADDDVVEADETNNTRNTGAFTVAAATGDRIFTADPLRMTRDVSAGENDQLTAPMPIPTPAIGTRRGGPPDDIRQASGSRSFIHARDQDRETGRRPAG